MPFVLWLFFRLIVPTGPVLIQYSLYGLGVYTPEFPQPTFIVLLFALSLATVTEYQSISSVIYGTIIPAISATVLYTVYLANIADPQKHLKTLLVGFYFWLFLVAINIVRVAIDGLKRWSEKRS